MAQAKQIQGKYFIQADIPTAYTLTGADRVASFGLNDITELGVDSINAPSLSNRIVFPVESNVTIKRVRLVANAGPGIQGGVNHNAGQFILSMVKNDGEGNLTKFDECPVIIPNWGEWYDINMTLKPYKRTGGDTTAEFVGMAIEKVLNLAMFYVDDFNLQEDYVGQGITPILQMEIETAGLVCQSNGVWF